ncbi:MAG TPA: Hsp20/alpha crystallin family protein [Candidatus Anoxymicrobiaceae bacterium]
MEDELRLAGPDDIQREVERFFEHLGGWKRPVFFFEKAWQPLCDVSETPDEVIVVIELAGVEPGNVNIAIEENLLAITGIRREPPTAARRLYHRMEISYGTFERRLPLPGRVEAASSKARYSEGFLEVRLSKASKEPSKEVEIDVTTRKPAE